VPGTRPSPPLGASMGVRRRPASGCPLRTGDVPCRAAAPGVAADRRGSPPVGGQASVQVSDLKPDT